MAQPEYSSLNLSSLPSGFRAYLTRGFKLLARVAPEKQGALLDAVKESLGPLYLANEAELSTGLGIKPNEVRPVLTAATVLTSGTVSAGEAAEHFVAACQKIGLVEEGDREAILAFASRLAQHATALLEALETAQIASSVLPTLESFDAEVDVRLRYGGTGIKKAVPVLLVHLDTDVAHEELWFQLSAPQLARLVKDLEEKLRLMREAEHWIDSRVSKKS